MLGRKCARTLLRNVHYKEIDSRSLIFSLFPYQYEPVAKLILGAKIHMHPPALQLFSKLWSWGLKQLPLPDLNQWNISAVPRPWTRKLFHGPGLPQSMIQNSYFDLCQPQNYFSAKSTHLVTPKKNKHTRTLFILKNKFRNHPNIMPGKGLVLIDDLYTTGTTMHQLLAGLDIIRPKNFPVIGIAFAYA